MDTNDVKNFKIVFSNEFKTTRKMFQQEDLISSFYRSAYPLLAKDFSTLVNDQTTKDQFENALKELEENSQLCLDEAYESIKEIVVKEIVGENDGTI